MNTSDSATNTPVPDMSVPVSLAYGIGIIMAVGMLLWIAIVFVRRHLSEAKRPWAFIGVFIALVACSCVDNWNTETARSVLGLPMLIMNALGTATLAFVGGNGFTMLPAMVVNPPDGKGADAIWWQWIADHPALSIVHIVFAFLNILAFALMAETILSMFTNVTTLLRMQFRRYDDVVIVKYTDDMREQARYFIDDLTGNKAPGPSWSPRATKRSADADKGVADQTRHLIFRIRLTPADDDSSAYTIMLKDGKMPVKRKMMESALGSVLAATASDNASTTAKTSVLTSVVFRNGRVTVLKHKPTDDEQPSNAPCTERITRLLTGVTHHRRIRKDGTAMARGIIDAVTRMETNDVYSYSLREIQTRQLMRHLIEDATDTTAKSTANGEHAPRFELGLRPLQAMVIGDDVESVALMVVYLIRNGQSLAGYPTIHIASSAQNAIEERLRCAYPALFPDENSGAGGGKTLPLTPPATIVFHRNVFEMTRSPEIRRTDGPMVVVFTSPDTGCAPSQRAIITRGLERRFGDLRDRLLFAQYSADEPAGYIHENAYGGRETPMSEDGEPERAIAVRLYGDLDETVSARVILHTDLDTWAMRINARYHGIEAPDPLDADDDVTPHKREKIHNAWLSTGLYGRESSRATADFLPIERAIDRILRKNGRTGTEPNHPESLGRLEHLRWNAYMVTSGYVTKPSDTARFVRDLVACARSMSSTAPWGRQRLQHSIRFGDSDTSHIALVDWDQLPRVDAAVHRLVNDPQAAPILRRFHMDQWVESMDMQQNDRNILQLAHHDADGKSS